MLAPAALAVGILASAAMANDAPSQSPAECLWSATPATVKAQLIAGGEALSLDAMNADVASEMVKACKLAETQRVAAFLGATLRSNTLLEWSTQKMIDAGATREEINAAWSRVGPKTRIEFSHAFERGFKPSKPAQDAITAMAFRLKMTEQKREVLVFDYIAARAIRDRLNTIATP